MNFPSKETVAQVRAQYPVGARVELVQMDDPHTRLRPGDQGIVDSVDDTGTVHISWDRGSTLGAVYGADVIRALPPVQGVCCRRCRGPVYPSELPQYAYQCFTCDEDLFSFEVEDVAEDVRSDCRYEICDADGEILDTDYVCLDSAIEYALQHGGYSINQIWAPLNNDGEYDYTAETIAAVVAWQYCDAPATEDTA